MLRSTKVFLSRLFSSASSKRPSNGTDHHPKSSEDGWAPYTQLGDSGSQNPLKDSPHYPQNNILQTNTFCLGEVQGYGSPRTKVVIHRAGNNDEHGLHSAYVRSERNFD
jgi:hypothetical protein